MVVKYKPKNTGRDVLGIVSGAIGLIPGGSTLRDIGVGAVTKGIDYALEKDEENQRERDAQKQSQTLVQRYEPDDYNETTVSWN